MHDLFSGVLLQTLLLGYDLFLTDLVVHKHGKLNQEGE